uniref:Cilia- and flagella-associated protein 206 n=1 Tax=Cacopsylla melanoneura TaxID=428564 RepID=A0A8D8UTE0_9HEMI
MSKHISEVDFFLNPMLKGIITVPYTNDKHILNLVYDRIVLYIILKSGLGTPEKSSVVKETKIALTSVFQVYSVKPFLKKSEEEKNEQLEQLTNIVTGIRLFYWHYGKHGDDIENIPDALVRGLNKSVNDLLSRKVEIENKVEKYADVLRGHFKFPSSLNNGDKRSLIVHDDDERFINNFEPNEIDNVRTMKVTINLLHQYMQQLGEIHSFMKYAHHDVRKTIDEFHAAFVDLQKLTKHKNKYVLTDSVPTDIVVVKFNNVASLWKKMWTYLVTVHDLNDLEERLYQIFNEARLASNVFITFLENTQEPSNGDRPNIDEKEILNINSLCKLVEFKSDIALRFHDFSTLFLILEGFFVPAHSELGVIHYKNENYAFSSLEEMYLFCKNPDKHLSKMSDTLRCHPELADTFQIKEHTIKAIQDSRKCETGIQTELHPIKRLIDKNYHFNAYELMRRHRKKTEAYLNCENKATKTCLLEDVSTQTQDQRPVMIQGSDKATNSMPRPFRYILGLRGFDNDEVIQDKCFLPLLNVQLNK